MQGVLVKIVGRHRPESVEPDVQRHALDVQSCQDLFGEMESGRRRGSRSGFARVHRLVALRIGERVRDVGRQRRFACRLAVQTEAPAAFAEVLEQLDRPVPPAAPQPPSRAREPFPETIRIQGFKQ